MSTKYFKCEIVSSTEQLWKNPETGNYEGTDPDSYQDNGPIESITALSLDELIAKVQRRYGFQKDAEEFEGRVQLTFDGEHDYRTPKNEQVPFIETLTFIITEVTEAEVNASILLPSKKQV